MAGLFDTLMQRRQQYQQGSTGAVDAATNGLTNQLRPDITDPAMRKRMGLPPLPTPQMAAPEMGTPEQEAYMRQLMQRFK